VVRTSVQATDLNIRPIRHCTEDRVRAHVLLRMLSYYLSWQIQARLAPILFTDDNQPAAQAARTSPVAPAVQRQAFERLGVSHRLGSRSQQPRPRASRNPR
jgi:hypothetical protein